MKTLNLLFFAFLISLMHNFYSQYNTIFLQSFTFLFLFELIIVKIFNRIRSKTTTNSENNEIEYTNENNEVKDTNENNEVEDTVVISPSVYIYMKILVSICGHRSYYNTYTLFIILKYPSLIHELTIIFPFLSIITP